MVLESSAHALLRSGVWLTLNHMERMLTDLWTRQHPNVHSSVLCNRKHSNSTMNFFRCANPIMILQVVLTTRDCRSKLAR